MYNLVSAATEIDAKDRVNLQPAHNHIEAVDNDGGEPANTSAAVALLRLRKECSDSPAFPSATVSTQPPDDRIALLNNTIKDLRNVIEDMRRREEDLRQERDRWHEAYLAAQRLIPTPAQHDAQASNGWRGPW
jgi:hypothetical protein